MSNNPNSYENQKLRGLKRKYEYVLKRGGKCEICGYDKNLAVLEFHHRDPNNKEYQVDMRKFSNTNLDKLEEELEKCDLLCSNCHREQHHPDLCMENIPEIIKDAKNKKSFSNNKETGQICPVCGKRFPKATGKIYCSSECRWKDKNYPSIEEVNEQYNILKSWEKVAQHFGLTRKIIQGIRKRNS